MSQSSSRFEEPGIWEEVLQEQMFLYSCKNRGSRSQIFFRIGVLKNLAKRPATLLKRDSNAGVFL